MKKFFLPILVLAFNLAQAQAPDPRFVEKLALSEAQSHLKLATFSESDDYAFFDLVYQKLNFEVDPAVNFIAGSVISKIRFLKSVPAKIHFDLSSALVVDSVQFDLRKIDFQHNSDKIAITLPVNMQESIYHQVAVFYHGTPPQTGFGSFVTAKHEDVWGLWTLSEPYGARDWWPCKESLADKIDSIDVYITCPSQYKAASNGKLISDEISGTKRIAHWQHRFPIATYLVAIAVTNYETYSDFLDLPDGKKLEILNYMYPEYLSEAKTKSTEIMDIMRFYNSKLIQYPFASEKYGHAQFGWGGGMEHQTMSFMVSLDFGLVAHEMAHQWFGDFITLASWHDIWLNEGFATYMTGLVYETLKDGYYWLIWKKQEIDYITEQPDGAVFVQDTTSVSRIFNGRLSYSKGSYLLHMLRWEMGDERFFAGLKNYLTDPAIANGFASQAKFVKHIETVADTSFTEFFEDWYYGEGYPNYQLNYFTDYGDLGKQKLRISQNPSSPSVSFFEMHLPVRVWKDGKSKDLRLFNNQQNQDFVISDTPIDSVQFDPERWLITNPTKVTSVPKITDSRKIQIIPEYSAGNIRIIIPDYKGVETFRIIDLNGKVVLNGSLNAIDSRIEIGKLTQGIYLIEVRTISQNRTEKIFLKN